MADTKITYKENKGFWLTESFTQLTLYYISQEIAKPQHNIPNKQELLNDLDFDIQGHTRGYMSISLFEYVNDSSDEQIMIQVFQNVKTTLQNKGTLITVNELMSIPTEDFYLKYILDKKPFPTSGLIKIIDVLIQMLKGTWTSTNYDMTAQINWNYSDD